jgi:predicted nucleic acid-binding protein
MATNLSLDPKRFDATAAHPSDSAHCRFCLPPAIIAQLCLGHDLALLTTDKDFLGIAAHSKLRVWHSGA